MRSLLRIAGLLVGLLLTLTTHAQLVAPPTVDWVSVPSTATVGQSVSVGAGGHANLSDNSDGNNWNDTEAVLAIIAIYLQRPGQSDWTLLTGWLTPWRTPADQWISFTVNSSGTHYVKVMIMDGRPWFSPEYIYAIGVPNPAPTITSALSLTVNQGQSVSYGITATNNPTSYGASGLPSGLSLNTSNGVISGSIPTNGGIQGSNSNVNSTITATNAAGTDSKTLAWSVVAASIVANGSVSPTTITIGQSLTLTRAGSANFGLAWTENVIWKPDGSAQSLGNMQLGSQSYTPTAGPGTYYYQIRFVDTYSNFKDQWVSFTVNDASAPSTPVGLAASNITSYSFDLSWTASTDNVGVTGYEVFRNGTSLGTTASTSFSVTGLVLGTNYSMTVRARDAAGNWSAQSAPLSVTTSGDTAAPSVPASLTYSGLSSTGFTLNWAASTDNVGVTAYEVLRNGVSLGTTASLSMTVTGLSPSTGYSMTVRARDSAGNWSAQSSPLNVTTPADTSAPSAPAGLSASGVAIFSFTLSWGASSDNVGVSAYEIFRNGVSLGTTGSLSASITGLSPNTTYAMTVRARDAAGNWSPQSAPLNVTTPADTTPPSTPTAPAAGSVMSYSVTLSWPAATDNVGVTAYEVFRDGVSQGTTTTLSLNLTSLAPGTTYALTIRARDAAGNWSAQSGALNVTTAASFEVFTPLQ